MDRLKLEGLTREELVALAGELGIVRPRSLTVPELIDEIISRTASSEREKARSRGWLGRARSLLASVIERGLHLPDVAKALRSAPSARPWPVAPPPLATMTLAEIYAAQGHLDKAFQVLDEILAREPEHADARSFRQRLEAQNSPKKKPEPAAKREEPSVNVEVPVVAVAPAPAAEAPIQEVRAIVPEVVETNSAEVAVTESPVQDVAPMASFAEAAVDVSPVAEIADEVAPVVEAAAAPTDDAESVVVEPAEVVESAATNTSNEENVLVVESLEHEASNPLGSYDRPDIEELPLPERYNVDEIVGIAVDPTTVYVYWEVRPIVMARAHARLSEGAMVVRLISVTPSWDGPVVEQRDLPIDALYGDAYVRGLRPGSQVRIGVGWLAHGAFAPFAIGDPVVTPRKEPAFGTASRTARWTPQGVPAPVESGQTTVAMLATALEHAATSAEVAARRAALSADRARLSEQWPTFDLGSRGLPAQAPKRASRPALGGSSELGFGGASEQVRLSEPVAP